MASEALQNPKPRHCRHLSFHSPSPPNTSSTTRRTGLRQVTYGPGRCLHLRLPPEVKVKACGYCSPAASTDKPGRKNFYRSIYFPVHTTAGNPGFHGLLGAPTRTGRCGLSRQETAQPNIARRESGRGHHLCMLLVFERLT